MVEVIRSPLNHIPLAARIAIIPPWSQVTLRAFSNSRDNARLANDYLWEMSMETSFRGVFLTSEDPEETALGAPLQAAALPSVQ